MDKKNIIELDFYNGGYGPTIRIACQEIDSLNYLKEVFSKLMNASIVNFELHNAPNIKLFDIESLCLTTQNNKNKIFLKIEMKKGKKKPCFIWFQSSHLWGKCKELVDGLIKTEKPGHQYLVDEGENDYIVELAFRE